MVDAEADLGEGLVPAGAEQDVLAGRVHVPEAALQRMVRVDGFGAGQPEQSATAGRRGGAAAMAGLAAARSIAPASRRVCGPATLGAIRSTICPWPQWRTIDRYRRRSAARGPR